MRLAMIGELRPKDGSDDWAYATSYVEKQVKSIFKVVHLLR